MELIRDKEETALEALCILIYNKDTITIYEE